MDFNATFNFVKIWEKTFYKSYININYVYLRKVYIPYTKLQIKNIKYSKYCNKFIVKHCVLRTICYTHWIPYSIIINAG